MSSNPPEYQIPPPGANFSFPPDDQKSLHFNSIDRFVASWVTPTFSSDPCFLSLYFWNGSNPDAPWISFFNKTISLNGTATVPLNCVAHGLGQLNLNYIDPLGGHQKMTGAIFNIDYNPTQPRAETWNANALSTLTSSTAAASPHAIATSSAQTPAPAPTTLSPPISSIVSSVSTSTTTPSPPPTSTSYSKSENAQIASIVLGTLLAILIIAILAACLVRRQRRKTPRRLDVHTSSSASIGQMYTRDYEVHEIDTEIAVKELGDGDRPWELATNER